MESFSVYYFDGKSSKPLDVTLELHSDSVCILELGLFYDFKEMSVGAKLKNTPQTISFKDGSYCELGALDFFVLPKNRGSRFILALEAKIKYAVAAFVVLVIATVLTLTLGSTYIANFLADKIPERMLERSGAESLEFLEKHYLAPSNLTSEKQDYIQKRFTKIFGNNSKLHFRSSPAIGANAFALPNDDIILLDELVELDKDENLRGIIAILAHERGHVVHKHILKTMIKSSISSSILGYLIGDFSGFATTIAAFTLEASYSREFENEADMYAIDMMNKNNISTTYMADVFDAALKKDGNLGEHSFLSSHPAMDERIKKLREH